MRRRYGPPGQSISSAPPSSPVTVNDGRLPRSDSAERGRCHAGLSLESSRRSWRNYSLARAARRHSRRSAPTRTSAGSPPERGPNVAATMVLATVQQDVGAARRVGSGDVHRVPSREGDPARVAVALLGNWAGGVHAQAQQRHGAGCDRDYPLPHRRRLSWQPPRERVDGRTSWLARGLVSPASGVDVSCLRRKLEAAGEPRLLHNVGGPRPCAPGGLVRLSWAPP
jgi:hypothetical protein